MVRQANYTASSVSPSQLVASRPQTKNLRTFLNIHPFLSCGHSPSPQNFSPPHFHTPQSEPRASPAAHSALSPVHLLHWNQRGLLKMQIANHPHVKKPTVGVLFLPGYIPFLGQGPLSKALLWAVQCALPAFSHGCSSCRAHEPGYPKHCSSSRSHHFSRPWASAAIHRTHGPSAPTTSPAHPLHSNAPPRGDHQHCTPTPNPRPASSRLASRPPLTLGSGRLSPTTCTPSGSASLLGVLIASRTHRAASRLRCAFPCVSLNRKLCRGTPPLLVRSSMPTEVHSTEQELSKY